MAARQAISRLLPTKTVMKPQRDRGRSRPPGANWPRTELLTWIRETRRMRSEEVHFLDSPTIGVLVFFKKIEG